MLNITKIRPVGAGLFHADRRTDTKLIVAFRSFVDAPGSTWLTSEYSTAPALFCNKQIQMNISTCPFAFLVFFVYAAET